MDAPEESGELVLRNRQRYRRIDLRTMRRVIHALAGEVLNLQSYEVRVTLVTSNEIARINLEALRHEGPTDVITFDLSDPMIPGLVCGDIYVCVEEAVLQAGRFGVKWQHELVRYVVHGFLHLTGYDDCEPGERRRMKREENRVLLQLSRRFSLGKLGGHWPLEQGSRRA